MSSGLRGTLIMFAALCLMYFGYKKVMPEKPPAPPPPASVSVGCEPDVKILLNGKPANGQFIAGAGWVMDGLAAGQYRLAAVKEGCVTQQCWVAVSAGSALSVALDPFVPLVVEVPVEETLEEAAEVPVEPSVRTIDLGGGLEMAFVWCPPGVFVMGPGEGMAKAQPAHEVVLSQGFWMSTFEVTQEQYRGVMDADPSYFKGKQLPVERVSWNDAAAFCEAVNRRTNVNCRLPTEAQWEYACRAGDAPESGEGLESICWYRPNSGEKTHPVGQKRANAWGLFDMQGNVSEWCADWVGDYSGASLVDPAGAAKGSAKVLRGGAWNSPVAFCKPTFRYSASPINANYYVGFRVVLMDGE